jgi:hypothetical protein
MFKTRVLFNITTCRNVTVRPKLGIFVDFTLMTDVGLLNTQLSSPNRYLIKICTVITSGRYNGQCVYVLSHYGSLKLMLIIY